MNNNPTLLLGAVLLCGGLLGFVLMQTMSDSQEGAQGQAELATQVATMSESLERLGRQMESMEERFDTMPAPGPANAVSRGIDSSEIDRLVAEAIARETSKLVAAVNSPDGDLEAVVDAETSKAQTLDRSIGRLLDPSLSDEDREALWDELNELGLIEEAIAQLEAEVEGDPGNNDLMNQLAYAYLQPIIRGGASSMEAGRWSMKADGVWDQILESDDHNWEARFSKAISYSFYPPIMGKGPEAIHHFEVLVGQQANQAPQDGFEQTHLMLGNMYMQAGDTEKANAAWQAGVERFPENAELRERLGLD
ncbi:MAG: tetratricopeptide repeat protein [Planctomycetota bacterium]